MTRIAIIADIHGNVPALEAVVEDIADQRVDQVLVGGDLVGRGPQGSAVVQRVRDLGWTCIQGNHEDFLLSLRRGDAPDEGQSWIDLACHRWMAAELTDEDERFIGGLPFDTKAGHTPGLRLVHGSPSSFHEGLGRWTSDDVLIEHLDAIEEPVLVCAHSHRPFVRRLDGRLVVNVGSVGLPFDGEWRARYALFVREGREWTAEHRCVAWDRDRLMAIYRSSGFLAAGGVTARLLEMEVMAARSHLVPFATWSRATGRALDWDSFEVFAQQFDPERGIDDFLAGPYGAPASSGGQ